MLNTDLDSLLSDQHESTEAKKLIRRGIELFKLFDLQLGFDESTLVRDLRIGKTLKPARGLAFSSQLASLNRRRASLPSTLDAEGQLLWDDYCARLRAFRARFTRFAKAVLRPGDNLDSSYADWLCLSELLNLQQGTKADWAEEGTLPSAIVQPGTIGPDENMFIIVHQCFELWFEFILAWVDRAIPLVLEGQVNGATHLMRHVVEIQKLLTRQIQIPATMLPLDFAQFRFERRQEGGRTLLRGLSPASGTESYQFREIEIVCGLRDDAVFTRYLEGTDKLPIRLLTPRQTERMHQMTLGEAFDSALRKRVMGQIDQIFTPSNTPNPNAYLAELADALLDFDEAFHLWRVGHVSMVKKMIGAKSGTGYLGPEYLMETAGLAVQQQNRILQDVQARPRFFEELWRVRTRLGSN